MLSAKEKRVPIEKRVGHIPLPVETLSSQKFNFLSDLAIELMRYPYISVQLEARYESDSSNLDSSKLRVIALINPTNPLTENCKFKFKGSGSGRYRPLFDVMDRFETLNGEPAHTLWEKHSVCIVTHKNGKIVLEFKKPCAPVVPEPGFIFNFDETGVRKTKEFNVRASKEELIASIVKHIKVPLYKANNKSKVINEGPFPVWNEPVDGDSEDAIEKWALVEHARNEFKAFLDWATPFPVLDDNSGMQDHVTAIFTGGVQAIYTRGLIPVAMQSPHNPEFMFKIPCKLRMPPEEECIFGKVPDWRTQPARYEAWLRSGSKDRKGRIRPNLGRVVAPKNEHYEEHEQILLGCSGKLVQRMKDLSAGNEIVIEWPKVFEASAEQIKRWDDFEQTQFNWLDCQKKPSVFYKAVIYNRRTTSTAAALLAGPVVTEGWLRKIEKCLREIDSDGATTPIKRKVKAILDDMEVNSEGKTTYVNVDYMDYGDTFSVLAFVHPMGIQYSLDIESDMEIIKPKLGWSLVPPVFLTVCNDERKGASFYLWDIDERDIHVAKSRSKVVTPKITVDKGLPGLYGYNLKRGLHVVSDLFLYSPKGIASTSMDDPVTVDRILSIAKPEFIIQMACTAFMQSNEFDEDIHKYLTYVAPPEKPVTTMLKDDDKRLTEAADCLRVYEEFFAKNPANPGMADDDYGVWEEGMYERSSNPVRMQLNGKMITVIRAKKTTRPYYLMARTSARYHPYRILGLPMSR